MQKDHLADLAVTYGLYNNAVNGLFNVIENAITPKSQLFYEFNAH